jgi:hypothetical protein
MVCAAGERISGLKRNSSNSCIRESVRLTTGVATNGYKETESSTQPRIPINQERTYVKICFYKGQFAGSILSSWIAN